MKQHFSQIRDYFKSGYGETVKITAAAFFILILLGYAAGTLFPAFTDDYVTRMLSLLGSGLDCALLSIPIRNMHSPIETANLKDISACCDLIVGFIAKEDANA